MKHYFRQNIKYIIYLIISIFMILILSKSTSPLYDGSYTIDSSVFQVIGKGITKGYIPYVDLFDHKGPILFFIEALGILINENIGIFTLQIINLFITIIFLDKLIMLFDINSKKRNIILIITLIFYAIIFGEGNCSEEWSLGLITIFLYTICKGLINNSFSKKDYFINGCIFAIISLIRLNNAATVVGFAIFYFFNLIVNKKYRELGHFILWFVIGALIVYIPIIIIFLKWNALYDMLYATFIFNFKYGTNQYGYDIYLIIKKIFGMIPLILVIYNVCRSHYETSVKRCLNIIVFINIICISVGYAYYHYYIILVPIIALGLSIFKVKINIFGSVLVYLSILGLLYVIIDGWIWCKESYRNNRITENEIIDIKNIVDTSDSILCYNLPARTYLLLDMMPSYKYFVNQSWHSISEKNIYDELLEYINGGNIQYIIVCKGEFNTLLDNYNLVYKNETFDLYELKSRNV